MSRTDRKPPIPKARRRPLKLALTRLVRCGSHPQRESRCPGCSSFVTILVAVLATAPTPNRPNSPCFHNPINNSVMELGSAATGTIAVCMCQPVGWSRELRHPSRTAPTESTDRVAGPGAIGAVLHVTDPGRCGKAIERMYSDKRVGGTVRHRHAKKETTLHL